MNEYIKQVIHDNEMTIQDMAKEIGISYGTLYKKLRREKALSVPYLIAMSEVIAKRNKKATYEILVLFLNHSSEFQNAVKRDRIRLGLRGTRA